VCGPRKRYAIVNRTKVTNVWGAPERAHEQHRRRQNTWHTPPSDPSADEVQQRVAGVNCAERAMPIANQAGSTLVIVASWRPT